ncbi:hypothetical protein THRCLA_00983 [Thraustotheca clavata]|uniref:Myosin motor domain-containing protein n=1 Tax=Thraustotheca clavata TaxID=74557 RepID=A0A1W0AAJ1_9STRA|nr:hypothetical protein THRCLA_00983 [Thraustotheca clavata]
MSRLTKKGRPPKGYEYLQPVMDALENELRERMNDPHEGLRKCEALWPIHQINWQRSRYVYDMYYKYKKISKEVYDYCLRMKLADANLIAKWKKPGYERLCSTFAINSKNYNYGTVSICRVPRQQLADGQLIQERHSGCRGCASGPGGYHNIFGNKYGQHLAAIQIMRERRGAGNEERVWAPEVANDEDERSDVEDEEETKESDQETNEASDKEETKEKDDDSDEEESKDHSDDEGPQPKKRKQLSVALSSLMSFAVWVQNPSQDGILYLPAVLEGLEIKTLSSPSIVLPATTPNWPRTDEYDVDDISDLAFPNEPCVLEAIHQRFLHGKHYTFVGSNVLIALNHQGLVNDTSLTELCDLVRRHLYMPLGRKHQALILAGNSGSGKSTIARRIIKHLVQAKPVPILESLVILEALGNARTKENYHSSRFGKSTKLLFNGDGEIVGCTTETYLLEIQRLTRRNSGNERNFDIFDQLLCGLTKEDKIALGLTHSTYSLLGEVTRAPRGSLVDTKTAFEKCGITDTDSIFQVLAAVLILGIIRFNGCEAAIIDESSINDIHAVEMLLGLRSNSLATELCRRTVPVSTGTIELPISTISAESARNTFMRALYLRLFKSIIQQLNQNLGSTATSSIEICDLFGFEITPADTGLHHFCQNYASEKLHQFFLQFTFKLEQRIYTTEKITVPPLTFQDNQSVLDLMDKQPQCILSLLEHTSSMRNATDDTFVQKLEHVFHNHPKFNRDGFNFIIRHSCCDVNYDSKSFVQENKSSLPRHLQGILDSCVVAIFGSEQKTTVPATAAGKFSAEIERRCISLCRTEPHFIKCISTCSLSGDFDGAGVASQLRHLGILDVAMLRQTGYCYRTTFPEFLQQFATLDTSSKDNKKATSPKEQTVNLLNRLWAETEMGQLKRNDTVQIGERFIFFRQCGIDLLEQLRDTMQSLMEYDAALIQKIWRGQYVRKCFRSMVAAAKRIARAWRRYKARKRPKNRSNIQSRYAQLKSQRSRRSSRSQKSQPVDIEIKEIPPEIIKLPVVQDNDIQLKEISPPEELKEVIQEDIKEIATKSELIVNLDLPSTKSKVIETLIVAVGVPPLLKLVLALRVQALYRGYKVRQEMGVVMHILELKRKVRYLHFAVIKIQAWGRRMIQQHRFHRIQKAVRALQHWCVCLVKRKKDSRALTQVIKIQAAARGFLIRNQLHSIAVNAIAEELAAKVLLFNSAEALMLSKSMTTQWCKPCSNRQMTVLSFRLSSDLSHIFKTSWAARLAQLNLQMIEVIVMGETHTLALMSDGNVFVFGWNDKGQLGLSSNPKVVFKPVALSPALFEKRKVVQLAAGQDHSVALCSSGSVYTWGGNKHGQLGLGHYNNKIVPTQVSVITRRVTMIAAGPTYTVVLVETGSLFQWGQLHSKASTPLAAIATKVDIRPPVKFSFVTTGLEFAVALSTSGGVYTWGSGDVGQLGLGSEILQTSIPSLVSLSLTGSPIEAIQVSCGGRHVICRCEKYVFGWGQNTKGQLGLGDTRDRWLPTRIRALDGLNIMSITTGNCSSAAVTTAKGKSFAHVWGDIGHGITLEPSTKTQFGVITLQLLPAKLIQSSDPTLAVTGVWSKSASIMWANFKPQQSHTPLMNPPTMAPKTIRRPEPVKIAPIPSPEPSLPIHINRHASLPSTDLKMPLTRLRSNSKVPATNVRCRLI